MKVGLALSGGGARGFAHIGVLKVLVENAVAIDMIAGTSAGSIVAAAYASGMSVDDLYGMARRVGWLNVTRPSLSPLGALSNAPMAAFLKNELRVASIEELGIPFAAVGYDLTQGEEVVFKDRGDLIFAVRTSCAVPGVFAPMTGSDGHLLVDGGVTTPLPVNVVRDMGADIVIAVDLLSCGAEFRGNAKTAAGIMIRSAMTLLRQVSIDSHALADIVIEPAIAHIRPDQINRREELLWLGEKAALTRIDEIKSLVSSEG
jgi:NTE family protein